MNIDLRDIDADLKEENPLVEYEDLIKDITFNSNLFIQLSREAKIGTKKLALECRKMSIDLTNKLKDFRRLSVINDRLK